MALRSFKQWKTLSEDMRSAESHLRCPYPKNKEFCREWNKYVNQGGVDPFTMPKFAHLKRSVRQPMGRQDTTFRKNDGYNRKIGQSVDRSDY